jgi:FtsP/CotA-like multicopper oxidase with cupredoxin domain
MLVNGQSTPTLAINANQWYRLRIVFSAAMTTADFQLDHGSCEMQLLAKVSSASLPPPPTRSQLLDHWW